MISREFIDEPKSVPIQWWFHRKVSKILDFVSYPTETYHIKMNCTIKEALEAMKLISSQTLVCVEDGIVKHVITKRNIMNKLMSGSAKHDSLALIADSKHVICVSIIIIFFPPKLT
jgi:hypothetical protein